MIDTIKKRAADILSLSAFREVGWYTFSNFTAQVLSFVGMLFVSRYLGPTNLGLYSFVQNYYLSLLTIIGGSDYYFSWAIAKSENKFEDIKRYTVHRMHIAIALSVIGFVGAWTFLPRDVAILCSIMFAPTFLTSLSTFYFYALSEKRAKLIASIQILSSSYSFVLKLILVFMQAPLSYFVFAASLDVAILATMHFIYFIRDKNIRTVFVSTVGPKLSDTIKFLFSIKISIFIITTWQILLRIDQIILAKITNAFSLGIYSAAVKVAEVPNVLAGTLYLIMMGRMIPLIKSKTAVSNSKLHRVFLFYFLMGIFMSIGIIIFAPIAIHIIFGDKFIESIPVLRMYALSIPGLYLSFFFFSLFAALEEHKVQAYVFSSAVILNIILVVLLTPKYGLVGTAAATAISYSFVGVIFYIYWHRKKKGFNIH